ncbi:MAG TPA: hypothetical protein DGG95_09600 [Cytophagales bacterium]|jgi:hypothetical protein|nr:hypothetical protein [Cytophagales bacterium]
MKKILFHLKDDWAKYLIELFVVVFGILGAFTLEKWNESRKSREVEISYLKDIISCIQSDIVNLQFDLDRNNEAILGGEKMIEAIKQNQPYYDSLSLYFASVNNYTGFESNKGAYESLKSIDLNIISNKTLRFSIINLYEKEYSTLKFNQALITEDIHYLKRNFYPPFFDKFLVISPTSFYHGEMIPNDFENLKKNKLFLYHLKSLQVDHEVYAKVISFKIKNLEKLVGDCMIEIER